MQVTGARAASLIAIFVSVSAAVSAQETKKLNPRDVAKLVAEADKAAAEGRHADAQKQLTIVIQQDPANAAVALKLGRVCKTLQDWDCVLTGYQLALAGAQGAEKAEAHAALASVYVRQGRHQDAAQNAREALAVDPAMVDAHVMLATSLVRLGSPDALAAAQKATEAAPSSAPAWAALGEALTLQNRGTEAEAPLRKALTLDPRMAGAHAGLAEILFKKGDLDAAIASATSALEIDPELNRLYALRGRAHATKGNQQQALADLQQAVTLNPQDGELQLTLGKLHRSLQNLGLAADHYRKAVSINPQLTEAFLGLGDILIAQGDFNGAREPVERAAALFPKSAQAQYLLGALREGFQQYDEALKAYEQATMLDPKLAAAHHRRGRVLREHRKDSAGALASLDKAVALDPANPDILTDLGVALFDQKQVDRAIELLRKAVASPGYQNPLGFGVLGLALKDKQAYDESLGHFDKAIALAPKWWLPHWGAAWSLFGSIKKGCPCGPEDEERIKKMKAHFDQMTALEGKDPALAQRVAALLKGEKIK
jgi:tetratricopeptide (TPR) repeat protein